MTNKIVFIIISLIFFIACKKENCLILKYTSNIENLDFRDTLKTFNNHSMYIGEYREYGFLGEFKTRIFIIKNKKDSSSIIYELINEDETLKVSITNDYINIVENSILNSRYGWFCYVNGFEVKLPRMEFFLDSLKNTYPEMSISEYNGLISIYKEGEVDKKINYGELIQIPLPLDSLGNGLYKFNNDKLIFISSNKADLSSQIDGIYYIPEPIPKYKYSIETVINQIDSVSKLIQQPPRKLVVYE